MKIARLILLLLTPLVLPPAHAQEAKGAFSVHEWGLISFPPGRGPARLQSSPPNAGRGGPRLDDMKAGKPVIFFHPEADFDPAQTISARVSIRGGALREVWPTPGGGPQPKAKRGFTWGGLKIHPGQACGGELAPSTSSPACASLRPSGRGLVSLLDLQCEAWEMSLYMPQIPHCLETRDGIRTPALIYNGTQRRPAKVASVGWNQKKPLESVLRSHVKRPLRWVYVALGEELLRFDLIEPEARIPLKAATERLKRGALLPDLQRALEGQGLTRLEAQAFIGAWREPLSLTSRAWSVLGFLDPAEIEARVPLEIKPEPRALVRVMAFLNEPSPTKVSIERALAGRDISIQIGKAQSEDRYGIPIARKVLRRRRGPLLNCYRTIRRAHPDARLDGQLLIDLVVGPNGKVRSARVIEGTIKLPPLARCLTQKIKRLRFPKPKGGKDLRLKVPIISKIKAPSAQ